MHLPTGHPHKQSSPLLDDTLAAVMTSHLGNSPMDYLPDYWTETMPQQEASTAYMGAQQQHSKSQQQQPHMLQQSHAQLAAGPAAAAAADPNAVLYANYRAQHPQAYAEADRLSYSIDMSSAAIAAAAHHQQQQGMLAAEQAFKARQLAQLQQQRLAYEQAQQQQHQQLVLAQLQQQRQAATAAVPAATANASALYRASSSHSAMTQQQHLPSSSYSHQQPSHYQTHSSMQAPSTTAARLPPRPSTTHSHHYHPYSTATGGAALEHHAADSRHNHHNSLVAAAAAARAAAVQQQNHRSSAATAARQAANAAAAAAAAALQRSNNAGRWSGAVAVLDQSYMTGTQESGIELECEEELHSMDGSDQAPHHHMMHSNVVASGGKNSTAAASAGDVARGLDVHQRSQLQGARLSGGAAQHAAAASAAARAAAANMALNALEDDDQGYDMYEESGSTHPDSDNQSDDMDADIVPVQDQYQRNSRNSTSAAEGSSAGQPGSRAAAAAAAVAGEQTSAAQQAVAVRILSSVANRRKGEEVLTAHPSTADAAGARSVRSRLLITEVSLYCDNAATSILALEQSNRLMAKMKLPGTLTVAPLACIVRMCWRVLANCLLQMQILLFAVCHKRRRASGCCDMNVIVSPVFPGLPADGIKYMPVSTDSFLFRAAHAWQFPAFVICLGSSYMQRMLAKLPQLTVAAAACPGFEDYCRYLPSLVSASTCKRNQCWVLCPELVCAECGVRIAGAVSYFSPACTCCWQWSLPPTWHVQVVCCVVLCCVVLISLVCCAVYACSQMSCRPG